MDNNKSIYYRSVLNQKPVKLKPSDSRQIKRDKFNKIKLKVIK